MNETYYQIEFTEAGYTDRDERIFATPEEAADVGWNYLDNAEAISAAWIVKVCAGIAVERLAIDDYPRPAAPEVKVKAPQRAGYVGYLAGFDVTWNDFTDHTSSPYRTGRILDTDTFGALLCQYVWRSTGESDDEGPINSRVDGPILFFTWTNLPVLTVLDKQPIE